MHEFSTLAQKCLAQAMRSLLRQPSGHFKSEILRQLVHHGMGSIPIVMICTVFAGLVITQEIAFHMDEALHTTSMIPGFTVQFIMRELGVIVPALLLVSKAGASMTAELGGMKITEQIDALRLLGLDPILQLAYPRWIAGIAASVALTLQAIAVTVVGALLMAVLRFGFSWQEYLNSVRPFVGPLDLAAALVKSLVFGAIIPLIACSYGLACEPGAQGVGTATTRSVVTGTVSVIALDLVLTYLFTLVT